ncbi:MAG: TSUP family transporter [Proteobacteria bacterium]|nr:TSUP family transporter [Pseudomonadota bacterium]
MILTPETGALLFATGLCAGFVDSIAGGGGLIALPVLLSAGLPPQLALGTNKLQGTCGTLTATINYIRKGEVRLKEALYGIGFTFIGAAAGAWAIQQMDGGFLKHLIPILLVLVFIYTVATPKLGFSEKKPTLTTPVFYLVFGLILGFYDGFFGPGTGSFWTAAFLLLLGLNMTKAAGYTRVMNFTSNIVSLTVFIIGGNVWFAAGLCMGAGQIIGARAGSGLAIKKGAAFIRPVFITVVFLTIARLVYVNYVR